MNDLHLRLAWEDLVEYAELGQVIPVIGEDLLRVDDGGRETGLSQFLARRLAERLRIDPADLAQGLDGAEATVNDVIVHYVKRMGGAREEIDQRLNTILRNTPIEIPESLRLLAAIPHFRLFVSLTYDPLLARAIDAVRFGGQKRTLELAFSINDCQDLPAPKAELRTPVVYHLFGKLGPTPSCALTEEDALEFVHHMQTAVRKPHLLFDELKSNHLLMIGCNFSDWLGRSLLRIAKSRRLSEKRTMDVLVWSAGSTHNLVTFLRNFSYRTKVEFSPPETFVAELHHHLADRPVSFAEPPQQDLEPPAAMPLTPPPSLPAEAAEPAPRIEPGALFISYSRTDLVEARQLHEGLDAAGFDVWLDVRALEHGSDYDMEIRRGIKACSYFLPIVSQRALGRSEGYFWREWRWAAERAQTFSLTTPFILPIVVDATAIDETDVPDAFKSAHVAHLPGGTLSPEFASRLQQLVRDWRRRARS